MPQFDRIPSPREQAGQALFTELKTSIQQIREKDAEEFDREAQRRLESIKYGIVYRNPESYLLYHLLAGTPAPADCRNIDFSGDDSIEKFIKTWRIHRPSVDSLQSAFITDEQFLQRLIGDWKRIAPKFRNLQPIYIG